MSRSSLWDNINPCIGCISLSCRSCGCREGSLDLPDQNTHKMKKSMPNTPIDTPKTVVAAAPIAEPGIAPSCGFDDFDKKSLLTLPVEIFGRFETKVVVYADGDGMRNAGIVSGDALVFTSSLNPIDGDIVIATVDGIRMCRRIFLENEREYRIRREDGETPDIITKDCIVHGVLINITHSVRRVS